MRAWRAGVRVLGDLLHVGPGIASLSLAILLFLAAGTLVRGWSRWRDDGPASRRRWRSIGTWWGLSGLFLVVLAVGLPAVIAAMALFSILLLREALALVGEEPFLPAGAFAVMALYVWAWLDGPSLFLVVLPAVIGAWAAVEAWEWNATDARAAVGARTAARGRISRVRSLFHAGFLALVGPSYLVAVASLPAPDGMPGSAMGWFALLVVLTELNDSAQAWGGRAFGTRRLAPRLSPGKTWEGLWSGMLVTAVASVILAPLLTAYGRAHPPVPWELGLTDALWLWPLALGFLVSVTGVGGDLLASSLKRRAGVKDSGDALPGHGGLLDRFDSLSVTAPVFYAVTWFLWH